MLVFPDSSHMILVHFGPKSDFRGDCNTPAALYISCTVFVQIYAASWMMTAMIKTTSAAFPLFLKVELCVLRRTRTFPAAEHVTSAGFFTASIRFPQHSE